MAAILVNWNSEKVMALAPDVEAAKAAKKLAMPDKWQSLGQDTYTAWGEYQGSGGKPYQVKIDLLRLQKGEYTLACTCPSRKQPCKHLLGLLFILVEKPDRVSQQAAPPFVQAWLDKEAQRARTQQDKKKREVKPVDPAQQAKTIAERKNRIAQGLDELERWLRNMIRHGLADAQLRQYSYWDGKAARMVDAQAPGIARWLREMAGIPAAGGDWINRLLSELGKLYLVIESFKRFDDLPAGLQADIRTVLGWHQKKEELVDPMTIQDRWLVIGRYEGQEEDRLRLQRLWLRGESTGRDALILEFAFGDEPFDTLLLPGQLIDAEMGFFPGSYPLRSFVQHQHGTSKPGTAITGESIESAIQRYSTALACNPWLLQFPMLLEAVIPVRLSGRWIIRETDGDYLPLVGKFPNKWALAALSGGHPITLAGEWDGEALMPTGAIVDGRFVDFSQAGKL